MVKNFNSACRSRNIGKCKDYIDFILSKQSDNLGTEGMQDIADNLDYRIRKATLRRTLVGDNMISLWREQVKD